MLILNPGIVTFGARTLGDVVMLTVDRSAHRRVEEWSDAGPYAVFADVPEQRVRVRVVQELSREDVGGASPGEAGTLTFRTSPASAESGRRKAAASAVVVGVTHEIVSRGSAGGRPTARRIIELIAVSPDGAADPITLTDGGAEV